MSEAKIYAEQDFFLGEKIVIPCDSPVTHYSVVFEDDGDTGYFYALDISKPGEENIMLEALHIYNVEDITDKHIKSIIQIVWSFDGMKSLLLINDYPHAVFDFIEKRGYCRTGFPPPDPSSEWSFEHTWDEEIVDKLF